MPSHRCHHAVTADPTAPPPIARSARGQRAAEAEGRSESPPAHPQPSPPHPSPPPNPHHPTQRRSVARRLRGEASHATASHQPPPLFSPGRSHPIPPRPATLRPPPEARVASEPRRQRAALSRPLPTHNHHHPTQARRPTPITPRSDEAWPDASAAKPATPPHHINPRPSSPPGDPIPSRHAQPHCAPRPKRAWPASRGGRGPL